jgi:hypothetical protein
MPALELTNKQLDFLAEVLFDIRTRNPQKKGGHLSRFA